MFVEKRETSSGTKYYLVHSYRDISGKSKKLRKYLGRDLSEAQINNLRKDAKKELQKEIQEIESELFFFSLSAREHAKLNELSNQIEVVHLDERVWKQFTEDFVFHTNAIEGSQVLEEDVPDILERSNPHSADEQEAIGVQKAIVFIRTTDMDVSKEFLLTLHELCFSETKSYAGTFRDVEVVIRNAQGTVIHQGVPVVELDEALTDLIDWYRDNKDEYAPLALAAIMHNQFEHIHPFQDGNGRIGRLLLNYILLTNEYPPIIILFEDRQEYYSTLRAYDKSQDLLPTIKFLIAQYKKTYRRVTTKNDER